MNLHLWLLKQSKRVEHALSHHPRSVTAGVVALLMGTGVTAFGVVAPRAADPSLLPMRVLVEAVSTADPRVQLEQLAHEPLELRRTERTRRSDTTDSLLRRMGVRDAEVLSYARQDAAVQALMDGRPNRVAEVTMAGDHVLTLTLRGPRSDDDRETFQRVTVQRGDAGYTTQVDKVAYQTESRLGSGVVRTSLFAASDDALIPDAATEQLAELFSAHIDFRKDLRKGDQFSVLYEVLTADNEPAPWAQRLGRVLAARFVNAGEVHEAVWYQGAGQRGAYYDFQGRSSVHQFLGSPLEFSRVTSGFAMRLHPVFRQWRAHAGVDFGAPAGTPVRTVGDGAITFAGVQSGYGNVIVVKHGGDHETRYAHLSRIDVKVGQSVTQGQFIGAVGATGWATGPHLHFEFRTKGEPQDPLVVARESEALRLSDGDRPSFDALVGSARAQLAVASSTVVLAQRFE